MNIQDYLEAATRENTRKSYRSAVKHYEVEWGGFLPSTPDDIARYLTSYAVTLSISTLRQRLAALGRWHQDQGFPDPTKAPLVKQVMKGIGEVHPKRPVQARPLQLEELETAVDWLESEQEAALLANDSSKLLRNTRDKALLLIGFWRAFRSDELCRMLVEHTKINPKGDLEIYLARSKTISAGEAYVAPTLQRLCPVSAYNDWIYNASLNDGPVFRKIHKSGEIGNSALHPDSIGKILGRIFTSAGIINASEFSTHSLRRGFATWAADGDWSIKELMEYVGWKDVKSAVRYIEHKDSVAGVKINKGLKLVRSNSGIGVGQKQVHRISRED
jgi:integrase